LTAAATVSLPMDAAKAGCAACLVKPCYPDQLICIHLQRAGDGMN
jgi:hypothetical protein